MPRTRTTCRPVAAGCRTSSQCCSGLCETRRTTPRNQRNRCVCPEGVVACGGACCAEGEVCDAGACRPDLPCDGLTCEIVSIDRVGANCMVSATCDIVQGCDLGSVIYDLDPQPCVTDADCTDYYDGQIPGFELVRFCAIGRQGWTGENDQDNDPINAPFSYYPVPRCVVSAVGFQNCD